MPNFSEHPVTSQSRVLLIGHSGAGKSAQIACLANAGYNVRVADFDNGLDVLDKLLTPEGVKRVHYETLTDTLTTAVAYNAFMKLLGDWPPFGGILKWGPQDVLVIDTLTFAASALMRRELVNDGKKPTDKPVYDHWGRAARELENLMLGLSDKNIKCNIVANVHVRPIEDETTGAVQEFPAIIGRQLPSVIGRYFNSVIRIDVIKTQEKGVDGKMRLVDKRIFRTESTPRMMLKHPAPGIITPEMDANLALLFSLIQKGAKK